MSTATLEADTDMAAYAALPDAERQAYIDGLHADLRRRRPRRPPARTRRRGPARGAHPRQDGRGIGPARVSPATSPALRQGRSQRQQNIRQGR